MSDDYDSDDLAARVREVVRVRYGNNKRAAYTAARVSPQTLDRALGGLPIRADKRAELEDWLTPVSPDGQTPDHDGDFLYQQPEGLTDEQWDRIREQGRGYLDGLIDAASRER